MPVENLSPDHLELDIENPRFGIRKVGSEEEAIEVLFKQSDLRELWYSIAENGFLQFETLVALRPKNAGEKYVVIEGNRRLAAVKTLLNPDILKRFSNTMPPEITEKVRQTLGALPVNVINERDEADEFIGFRHVNGAKTWGPLAKAKFGLKLYTKLLDDLELNEQDRVTILAKRIGDQPTQIVRNLVAFKVLQQAISMGILQEDYLEK